MDESSTVVYMGMNFQEKACSFMTVFFKRSMEHRVNHHCLFTGNR